MQRMPTSKTIRPKKSNLENYDLSPYKAWGVIVLTILLVGFLRARLLNVPLERDEGEYAYMGQLLLQGIPPYKLAYSMKLPGIYAVYGVIMAVFGQTITAIHLGLLLANVITIVLLFLIAKRIADNRAGIIAAIVFAVLSISPLSHGLAANAEHFVVLFALGGILCMLKAIESQRLHCFFLSGLLLGFSMLVKQHGGCFAIFAGLYILLTGLRKQTHRVRILAQQAGLYICGLFLPYGLACLFLFAEGVFDNFWFWTATYSKQYATRLSLSTGVKYYLSDAIENVFKPSFSIWILGIFGFAALFDHKIRRYYMFIIGFTLFSLISVFPGYFFRRHYFILLLPATAVLIGIGYTSAIAILAKRKKALAIIPVTIFGIAVIAALLNQGKLLFSASPIEVSRAVYGLQPFPEALEIAKYIKRSSTKQDTIAVLGSEPEIFFYANRRSATSYIYVYPLMEEHSKALEMQNEMMQNIQKAKPKFIVSVVNPLSWGVSRGSVTKIFNWSADYCRQHYKIVGIVDMLSADWTDYYWDNEARKNTPQSQEYVIILERKT